MYGKYIPYNKLVVGIPAYNIPLTLADENKSGLKAQLDKKAPEVQIFKNIKSVSKFVMKHGYGILKQL
jgi:hypothetical protein